MLLPHSATGMMTETKLVGMHMSDQKDSLAAALADRQILGFKIIAGVDQRTTFKIGSVKLGSTKGTTPVKEGGGTPKGANQ